MNGYLIAFVILIIGIIFLWLAVKSEFIKTSSFGHYIIIIIIFMTLGMMAYVLTDSSMPPNRDEINNTLSVPPCNPDFKYRSEIGDCYNEQPFGHSVIGLFQLLTGMFGFGFIVTTSFFSWRMYLTPKILYLINDFIDENKPIPKYIDTYRAGDYVWSYKGYGALVKEKENEIHICHKSMLYEVSKSMIMLGECKEINTKQLFKYLGNNKKIYEQVIHSKETTLDSWFKRIFRDEITSPPRIFVPKPLKPEEYEHFYSVKGGYGFDADRFQRSIHEIFRMRKAIEIQYNDMTEQSNKTLTAAVKMAEKSAVIGSQVSKLRQQGVQQPIQRVPYQEDNRYQEQQRQ